MNLKLSFILMCSFVVGCAGRSPQPVAVVQPSDRFMDCPAISAEAQANNIKLQELAGEQGSKTAQNVAAGVVGLFIWPVWFAMDFQGTASSETNALSSRNQCLATLADQRHCGAHVVIAPSAHPAHDA
jgi:hypothetical protein